MERLIQHLFDYQRFAQLPQMASLIEEVERSYLPLTLSDEDLEGVAAAGDPFADGHRADEGGTI